MFNFFGDLIGTVFFEILLTIDTYLYKFFALLYGFYLQIANMTILTDSVYTDISDRIYLVVGIVALFMVAYSILQNIINPDDKKSQSGVQLVKRILIAFVAVILIPTFFNFLYSLQSAILSGNVISNIINDSDTYSGNSDIYSPFVYTDEDTGSQYYLCNDCDSSDSIDNCSKVLTSSIEDYTEEGVCNGYDVIYGSYENFDLEIETQQLNGNYMAYSILSGFMNVVDGYDPDEISPDLDAFIFDEVGSLSTSTALIAALAACAVGTIGAVTSVAFVPATAGISGYLTVYMAQTAVTGCTSMVATGAIAGAIAGAATGLAIGTVEGVYNVINEDNYTWAQVQTNVIYDGDFEYIIPFASNIGKEISYFPIVSTIAIAFVVYMLLNFIIDLAIRVIKLAFYQIIAPIPIFLSILPSKEKVLQDWLKIVLTTYFEIFVRVAAISFIPFFVSALNSIEILQNNLFLNAILIIAIISFAKQVPKLVSEVTGIKSDGLKLGLRNRLADGGALTAGAAIGSSVTSGVNVLTDKRYKGWNKAKTFLKDTTSGMVRGGIAGKSAKNFTDVRKAATSGSKDTIEARNKRYNKVLNYKAKFGLEKGSVFMGTIEDKMSDIGAWAGAKDSLETIKKRIKVREQVDKELESIKSTGEALLSDTKVRNDSEMYVRTLIKQGGHLDINGNLLDETLLDSSLAAAERVVQASAVLHGWTQDKINIESEQARNSVISDIAHAYSRDRFESLSDIDSYNNIVQRGYVAGETYFKMNGQAATVNSMQEFANYLIEWDKEFAALNKESKDYGVELLTTGVRFGALEGAKFDGRYADTEESIKDIAANQMANAATFGVDVSTAAAAQTASLAGYEELKSKSDAAKPANAIDQGVVNRLEREQTVVNNNNS